MSDSRPSVDLASRAARGDTRAVATLLTRHAGGLVPYLERRAGRLLLDREAPEDLAQSICREVLERGTGYAFGDETAFRRWLYATALRKIRDRYRFHRRGKRDVRQEDGNAATVAEAFTPSRDAAGREEVDRVLVALEALPPRDREIVRLARIERLPHDEIARRLGVTESHSRTLLARAVLRLTRMLGARRDP